MLVRQAVGLAKGANTPGRETVGAIQELRAAPEDAGAAPDQSEPLDLEEVRATLDSAQATVQELNTLAASLSDLLGSADWDARRGGLTTTLAETEAAGQRVIDHAFSRLLILAGVCVVGAVGVVVLGRFLPRRPASA